MRHLVRSFQEHIGDRGCHFYDDSTCNFLSWFEVFRFIESLPSKENEDPFSEKLAESLSNYDPNTEFLAVQQNGTSVSVELYTNTAIVDSRI